LTSSTTNTFASGAVKLPVNSSLLLFKTPSDTPLKTLAIGMPYAGMKRTLQFPAGIDSPNSASKTILVFSPSFSIISLFSSNRAYEIKMKGNVFSAVKSRNFA
jgi:hypothetical protein